MVASHKMNFLAAILSDRLASIGMPGALLPRNCDISLRIPPAAKL